MKNRIGTESKQQRNEKKRRTELIQENIKKSVLYFPLEADLINQNNVSALIEQHGPKGYGTHIMILTELRFGIDYQCSLNAIKGMARRCKISIKLLNQVLYDFNLFEIREEAGEEIISSPYLDRVMQPYEEKMEKLTKGGKKRADKSNRNPNGQFTSIAGALNKIELDENKTTTSVVVTEEEAGTNRYAEMKSWEECFAEAMTDESWLEIAAMNSGMSRLFVKYREWIIKAFHDHIVLQDTGSTIRSVKDIKSYFANFTRQGKPTQKRIAEQLAELEEQTGKTSPNRYETIDPKTGQRTYFGNPIPPEAPPRPNDNAVWSQDLRQWI